LYKKEINCEKRQLN